MLHYARTDRLHRKNPGHSNTHVQQSCDVWRVFKTYRCSVIVQICLLSRLSYRTRVGDPRPACGPHNVFKQPASLLCSCNVKTARERMWTKHGLHPCYVTVAGDVAPVLVSVRFHTDIIKLRHVLFNKCYR